jgi:hypothetical protein
VLAGCKRLFTPRHVKLIRQRDVDRVKTVISEEAFVTGVSGLKIVVTRKGLRPRETPATDRDELN